MESRIKCETTHTSTDILTEKGLTPWTKAIDIRAQECHSTFIVDFRKKKKKTYVDVINHHFNPGGGDLHFRLDIILVKGLSKHTLNTYFSGKKIDPKYAFFACVFLNFPYVLSKMCQYDQKHTLFSIFARFCPPKRCKRVHCLVLKNNPNYVNFLRGWYPTLNTSAPPPGFQYSLPMLSCQIVEWLYRSS